MPCPAWPILRILVFHLLYRIALLNFGSFSVEHSTLQRWFDQIGQKSFPSLLYLNWACGPLESLPTLLLRRDLAHLYHLFLLVQVDLLDPLDQEVLGVFGSLLFSFRGRGVRGGGKIIPIPIITGVRVIITCPPSLITISSGRTSFSTWESLIPTSSSRGVSSTPIPWWVIYSTWTLISS